MPDGRTANGPVRTAPSFTVRTMAGTDSTVSCWILARLFSLAEVRRLVWFHRAGRGVVNQNAAQDARRRAIEIGDGPQATVSSVTPVSDFYKSRGFGGAMGFGVRSALVVVDLQLAFTDPEMPLGASQDCEIEVVGGLLDAYRTQREFIIFLGISYQEVGCADAGLWIRKNAGVTSLAHGSVGTRLDPRLGRRSVEPLLLRRYPSGFFGTDLATRLATRGVDTAVVVGCTTSGCVRATVVDALQHGFRPIVAADGVADRSEDAHRQSLIDIQAKYGDVLTAADIVALAFPIEEARNSSGRPDLSSSR